MLVRTCAGLVVWSAAATAVLCGLPWLAGAGLFLTGLSCAFAECKAAKLNRFWSMARWVGLLASCVAFAAVLRADAAHPLEFWSMACGVFAWLTALSFVCAVFLYLRPLWAVSSCTLVAWLAISYVQAFRTAFLLATAASLGLLLATARFSIPTWAAILRNTLVAFLVGLPLADMAWSSAKRPGTLGATPHLYSYAAARNDPVAFEQWWGRLMGEWSRMLKDILEKDPERLAFARLRPGARSSLFQSSIVINNSGFRGPELETNLTNLFRTVALGESTTFGCTLSETDRPWPELLQNAFNARSQADRRYEVINAGVPSYTILDNLRRLERDILPLRPNLLISYHGYNGFQYLDAAVPSVVGGPPPPYKARALNLLADCEYRLKVISYRRHLARHSTPASVPVPVMETPHRQFYEGLISFAHTNNIRLVLCTFSMAVNSGSPNELVEFYQLGFPSVRSAIRANSAHNELVLQLGKLHPEILVVDTRPALDGVHTNFVDLVHLTQPGRELLKERIYRALELRRWN